MVEAENIVPAAALPGVAGTEVWADMLLIVKERLLAEAFRHGAECAGLTLRSKVACTDAAARIGE